MTPLFFAVSGRFHGDDEATTLLFECPDREAAVAAFKLEMCALQGLTEAQTATANSDSPPADLTVYVDTVLKSLTRIEHC